jgi:hypothetical protein
MEIINTFFTNNFKIWFSAVLFWILMFLLSIPFVNPETGAYRINLYFFHGIMFLFSTLIMYFFFKYFQKKGLFSLKKVLIFLFVNILIDWILLIPVFDVSKSEWFSLILPTYLLGSLLVYRIVSK